MRLTTACAIAVMSLAPVHAPAKTAPSAEALFAAMGLLGDWAADCSAPASAANPHVSVTNPRSGAIEEAYEFGADFAPNHYDVVAAERLSLDRVRIGVLFQAGSLDKQAQVLIYRVRGNERRTLFNRVEDGDVRVKDGIVLATGNKTPVLKKCG